MVRILVFPSVLSSLSMVPDIVIHGGTPGGIAPAISAAWMGRDMTFVEHHAYVGGMTTSGPGRSDIENSAMIGGIFKESGGGVSEHYLAQYDAERENPNLCQEGDYAEPHAVEKVFVAMIAKAPNVTPSPSSFMYAKNAA